MEKLIVTAAAALLFAACAPGPEVTLGPSDVSRVYSAVLASRVDGDLQVVIDSRTNASEGAYPRGHTIMIRQGRTRPVG